MSDMSRHQQIQDRVEKATPGPWHQGPHYKSDVESPTGRVTECGTLRGERAKKDAAFIAHARQDIPYLLELCASQEAEIAHLRTQLDEVNALADRYATSHGGYCGNAKGVLLSLPELEAELSAVRQQLAEAKALYEANHG